MKRLLVTCLSAVIASPLFAQINFTNITETGIALPSGGNTVNGPHLSSGLHVGNHLDLSFGSRALSWGLGAYIGHISASGVNDDYREAGIAIASRNRLALSQLSFDASAFQSTQFLVGPVASYQTGPLHLRLWAKGGWGINEPSRYTVSYREGNTDQKIYTNKASENKNGLAYDLGAGMHFMLSPQLGLQMGASYNGTQTDQVTFNYERDKGNSPAFSTTSNAFIKASIGLVFSLQDAGGTNARAINTSRSNVKSPSREAGSGMATGRRVQRRAAREKAQQAYSNRDAGSGLATGKRMHQPIIIRIEPATDEEPAAVVAPRDAASGMATGKRMHKPVVLRIDYDYDEPFDIAVDEDGSVPVILLYSREAGSGMATGKRMKKAEDAYQPWEQNNPDESAVSNPLYKDKGKGENPLYEAKGIQEKGIKRSTEEQNALLKTVNTSRANIKRVQYINCENGACDTECVLEIDGVEHTLLIKGRGKKGRRVEVLKSN